MSEQLSSLGRETYSEEIQRPSGRSFLSEGENGTNGHTLPDADQFVPDPTKREWFADYRRWSLGQSATRQIVTHVGARTNKTNRLL